MIAATPLGWGNNLPRGQAKGSQSTTPFKKCP